MHILHVRSNYKIQALTTDQSFESNIYSNKLHLNAGDKLLKF